MPTIQLFGTDISESAIEKARSGTYIPSLIQVSDTGIGISLDFLPYVFERFRQANSSRSRAQGGLGLGLSIVYQLVELHGGTVGAESPGEGQGATFKVQLPLLKTREREGEMGREGESKNFPPSLLDQLRVLVVDDEAGMLELLTTILEQYGAQVTAVARQKRRSRC